MLSNVNNTDKRYNLGMFIPNDIKDFELSKEVYYILITATSYDKNNRYMKVQVRMNIKKVKRSRGSI